MEIQRGVKAKVPRTIIKQSLVEAMNLLASHDMTMSQKDRSTMYDLVKTHSERFLTQHYYEQGKDRNQYDIYADHTRARSPSPEGMNGTQKIFFNCEETTDTTAHKLANFGGQGKSQTKAATQGQSPKKTAQTQ